jgi:5'-nucleotidase
MTSKSRIIPIGVAMRSVLVTALAGGLISVSISSAAQNASGTVDVSVLAINDFHGNLMPPLGGIRIADENDPSKRIVVSAGGAERMATLIKELRAKNRNNIFVAAGDLIGASPMLSALFHDEPAVEALSLMGLEVSAVGNHEFDKGVAELMRMQNGGCHPTDGCNGPGLFTGAKYHYLAASTVDKATGKTILPPYYVKQFDGIPVAFIGLALKGTPEIVASSGTAGLEFKDEAETVNALIPELRTQGIEAIVVLIHEGGTIAGDSAFYNGCPGISGHIVDIVRKLDKAVDVVVSGHTHQAYNCIIDGRLVTSAHRFGTLVTEIDLKLDAGTHDVIAAKAENLIVHSENYAKAPEETKLISAYQALAAPIANRVVGTLAQPLLRDQNPAGESTLGDVIADAELAATRAPDKGGAEIAFMNSGGVRTSLTQRPNGTVTYADLFAVQPFSDVLVTLTLTGAQIKTVLEEQWSDPTTPRMLQVSGGFTYMWDGARASRDRVLRGSLTLDGTPIQPQASYRVAVPDFLADGGDGLVTFREGKDRRTAMSDLDATEAYFRANAPISPPASGRVKRGH